MASFTNPDGSFFGESDGQPLGVVSPASAATVTMRWNQRDLYIANAATLAALTIQLPYISGSDQGGQKVEIGAQSSITALTIETATGATIAGAPTTLGGAGARVIMRYQPGNPVLGIAAGWIHWD